MSLSFGTMLLTIGIVLDTGMPRHDIVGFISSDRVSSLYRIPLSEVLLLSYTI